ncbi:sterol desaturase family protein [Marinoscillum sp. 108]|uniref:sterol desaturase family protein n=1 Tax=Marinoscillum sp. 108 TaxID=2653151 RepID=UPI0012EF3F47|nr:sterol desaturase family protein [Marinoscillum sp. 108]VXD20903.1 Sterol desaturase/sphingolipid hydroxylase (Fatty acid hydroxylase superfamily) [Marinoscillum sp. 108]
MELKNKPHTKGTKALFKNPVLERLTRTHIAIPLILFSTISTILIVYGINQGYINAVNTPLLFVAGLLAFTLIEYIMHRFLFHLQPKTDKQEKFAYTVHGVHHDYPKDKDRLAMPPPLSIVISALFFGLYWLIMGNLVYGFLPGFLMGYASYLWVHYMVHAFKPPKNFFKVLWVHHGIHHYKDQHNAFGVSSPLWDVVFGTMPKK